MTLEQLQLDISGRLDSLPAFEYVPVRSVRPRDEEEALQIQTELDQTLAGLLDKNGRSGATVIVQMPTLDVRNPDIPGPDLEVTTVVRVMENPLINMGASGSRLSAETLGLAALGGLHLWDPGSGVLYARGRAMEPSLDFEGLIVYDVLISSRLGLSTSPTAPEPRAEVYGDQAALTCGLEGAEMRYTLDGSFPGPSATLYTAPLDLTGADLLRAAAYKDGLLPSSVTELHF